MIFENLPQIILQLYDNVKKYNLTLGKWIFTGAMFVLLFAKKAIFVYKQASFVWDKSFCWIQNSQKVCL